MTLENTGHGIVVHVDHASWMEAGGVRYWLEELDFHHPSEHPVKGDPVQPVLFLRVNAEVRRPIEQWARRNGAGHRAIESPTELFLQQSDEFFDAHGIEYIFQTRFGAVGPIAVLDEQTHHSVRHFAGVTRLYQHTGITGEIVMPGNAARARA